MMGMISFYHRIFGIFLIYLLCFKFEKINSKIAYAISNNIIIIWGFHGIFIYHFGYESILISNQLFYLVLFSVLVSILVKEYTLN